MSKKQYTFTDGTESCPVCHSRMSGFSYCVFVLSETNRKRLRNALKNGPMEGEASIGGTGRMCRKCYGRRRGLFFFLVSLTVMITVVLLLLGIVFKNVLLGSLCVLPPLVFFTTACVICTKKRYDMRDAFNCYTDISHEFIRRFMDEHPEETGRNCIFYAEENKRGDTAKA